MDLDRMLDLQLRTPPTIGYKLLQLCSVCGKPVGSEAEHPQEPVELARIIRGTCPCCGQSAPASPDAGYLARARRWIARQDRQAEGDTPNG